MSSKDFYDKAFTGSGYAHYPGPGAHPFLPALTDLVRCLGLANQRSLEVGCGRGYLQDAVEDYTGLDLSDSVRQYLHRPFVQGCATELPFADGSFGCLWTYAALEHILRPETALAEMRRVLRDGGVLLLAPAWQCRPWAAAGLAIRPYGELPLRLKLEKAMVPIRDSVPYRALFILPQRVVRLLGYLVRRQPTPFRYRVLKPNYEHFWGSDSDAVNHMDPYEAILWFASRGDECLSHTTAVGRFLVRTGCLVFRVRKG